MNKMFGALLVFFLFIGVVFLTACSQSEIGSKVGNVNYTDAPRVNITYTNAPRVNITYILNTHVHPSNVPPTDFVRVSPSGMGRYPINSRVSLTAISSYNYTFANWTEDGIAIGNNNITTILMNRDRNITAQFRRR